MRFVSVRVRNFRSFLDSGEIAFAPGFNVIVGKNNSGKPALLQALQASGLGAPQRSQRSLPTATTPIDPVIAYLFFGGTAGSRLEVVSASDRPGVFDTAATQLSTVVIGPDQLD